MDLEVHQRAPRRRRPDTGRRLAWGIVKPCAEALDSPTLAHRGSIVEIEDPDGNYTIIRAPYRFSNGESGVRGPAPHQDEHRAEILSDWLNV